MQTNRRKLYTVLVAVLVSCVALVSRQVYAISAQIALESRLLDAIKRNDLRSASGLINSGASPNSMDNSASKSSLTESLRKFVRHFINKDRNTETMASTLLVALNAWWKPGGGTDMPQLNTAIVELLILLGANVNYKCADGDAPIILASISGRPGIVQLLINKGADVNVKDEYGYSALDYADGRYQHDYVPAIISILKRAGAKD